jgi:hypothetical protein
MSFFFCVYVSCLGDFYVSLIVFKHILFDETPLVLLVFLIHERKQAKCHDLLFKFLKEKIPRIDKKQVPVVVDQELMNVCIVNDASCGPYD